MRAGTLYCMVSGSTAKLMSQMRRGAIEYCVLALLRKEERYGFDLVRSLAETARILQIPPGTVKSRTFYGLRALRRVLAAHDALA